MTDYTVAHDHLVYVLLLDRYDHPLRYCGAEAAKSKMRAIEIADFGYAHDYVIRAVRLDSGE